MSAPASTRFGTRLRSTQPAKTPLRLVAPVRARTSRTPFVVVVMLVLACGLSGLILISTLLQSQSFELSNLQKQSDELQTRHDALAEKVAKEQSPSAIADSAKNLGMVPSATPVFLDLSKGSVTGKPTPAKRDAGKESAR